MIYMIFINSIVISNTICKFNINRRISCFHQFQIYKQPPCTTIRSIISNRLSADLYRPSSGFFASSGIFQLRPSRITPGIFPSEHKIRTLLSEIPHFSAACFTDIYISISPRPDNNIPQYRNNSNAIGIIFSVYRNNTKKDPADIIGSPRSELSHYLLFFPQ